MDTYNEIFLPIELNKALQNILSNIHLYYRNRKSENDLNEIVLKRIYKPILDCPKQQKNIVWFNAWSRDYSDIWLMKDCDDISKKIISVYHKKRSEYDTYVSSLSALAKHYGVKNNNEFEYPFDYAYLILTGKCKKCDIEMSSEHARDYFVYLNFESVAKLFKGIKFDEYYNVIKTAFKNDGEEKGYAKIIELLQENHKQLSSMSNINDIVNELTARIFSSWGFKGNFDDLTISEADHRNNIIRLVNYYFWVKLAYPGDWQVLLYLPGIITKRCDGVPMGVNIGLKEMVPLEIILFFKRAVLLFFTRESVDYFEDIAKEQKRLTNYLNKLLADFQHTLLQKVMDTIILCVNEMLSVTDKADLKDFYKDPFIKLCQHIKIRGTYLDKLASNITNITKQKKNELATLSAKNIEEFVRCGLFVNSKIFYKDNFKISLENWRAIVQIKCTDEQWTIKTHTGAVETILENLMHNSVLKHVKFETNESPDCKENNFFKALHSHDFYLLRKCFRVQIVLGKQDGVPFLVYYDTGKGFKLDAAKNLIRWLKEGPSEKELNEENNKGYAYWLIGRILEHIGANIKFTIHANENSPRVDMSSQNDYFENTNIVNKHDLMFENLISDNIRLIHRFIFKSG